MSHKRTSHRDPPSTEQICETVRNGKDRRVKKTLGLLREALHALIAEVPYDRIAVTDILERANVGRSTFYTHFRDKDELLVSTIFALVEVARLTPAPRSKDWRENAVWFSLPIFEYHALHRHKGDPKMGLRGKSILHEHLQRAIFQMVSDVVGDEPYTRKRTNAAISAEVAIKFIASTFVFTLDWWLESRSKLAPNEVNALFRALVFPSLT